MYGGGEESWGGFFRNSEMNDKYKCSYIVWVESMGLEEDKFGFKYKRCYWLVGRSWVVSFVRILVFCRYNEEYIIFFIEWWGLGEITDMEVFWDLSRMVVWVIFLRVGEVRCWVGRVIGFFCFWLWRWFRKVFRGSFILFWILGRMSCLWVSFDLGGKRDFFWWFRFKCFFLRSILCVLFYWSFTIVLWFYY